MKNDTILIYEADDGQRFLDADKHREHQFKLHLKKLEAINKNSGIDAGLPWIILGVFIAGYLFGCL